MTEIDKSISIFMKFKGFDAIQELKYVLTRE